MHVRPLSPSLVIPEQALVVEKNRGAADTCAAEVASQPPVQLAHFFSSHLGPLASSNNAPSFCSSIHALLPRRRLRWPGMQQHQA